MKTSRLLFSFEALIVVAVVTGCGYAKQADVDALRKELAATRDSLSRLWGATRQSVMELSVYDTILPPPKCPGPKCPILSLSQPPFPPPPKWSSLTVQAH